MPDDSFTEARSLSAADVAEIKLRVQSQLWRKRIANSLPLDADTASRVQVPEGLAESPTEDRFEVVSLGTDEARWRLLFGRYTGTSAMNNSPWYRCLSILKSHEAATCVIEQYYVCLDYKSEIVAFYSQLDAAQRSVATRLHFFAKKLSPEDVTHLAPEQIGSYLGYVVCRSGGLPLVGRTMIKPPHYMKNLAAVEETVHFFGQPLTVEAVPFMQQDTKLAACAQVAVWVAHYSAYRRGITHRRLIAEIVELSSQLHPLTPRVSSGLQIWEISALLEKAGLQSAVYHTPSFGISNYPRIAVGSLTDHVNLMESITAEFGSENLSDLRDPNRNVVDFAYDLVDLLSEDPNDEQQEENRRIAVRKLFDAIFVHMFEPIVRSRFAIYCATREHAVSLIGIDRCGTVSTFYLHDDQFGPYLASSTLFECSRDLLRRQAEYDRALDQVHNHNLVFADRSHGKSLQDLIDQSEDVDHKIFSFVVPIPNRLVLSPAEADNNARAIFDGLDTWSTRSTIMMGIDYKEQRYAALLEQQDLAACRVIANLHLAEWVVVVEGFDQSGRPDSIWEIVYDGTTGSGDGAIQFVRLGPLFVASHPSKEEAVSEVAEVNSGKLPFLAAPPRIGKTR